MNRDLFLSILAFDSYNRGYGQRVNTDGDLSRIGYATISLDALDKLNQQDVLDADFYAVAYNWNGDTIISYRGTDNLLTDAATGYGVGAGIAGVPQGNLASQFYQAVTGKAIFDINTPQDAVVTGHSLGGGLAGFVSMISGGDAVNDNCREGLAA